MPSLLSPYVTRKHPVGKVLLTREEGKNGELAALLRERDVPCCELPMVQTAPGPDYELLPQVRICIALPH